MCNECMEQCAIYTFLPVGPTWDGLSGPIFPFLAILGSSVKGRNLPRGPSSVGGVRYSAMRCVEGGFPLERCLSHGRPPPGFGCRSCCLTGVCEARWGPCSPYGGALAS